MNKRSVTVSAILVCLTLLLSVFLSLAIAAEVKPATGKAAKDSGAGKARKGVSAPVQPATPENPLELNTAIKEQLLTLPGITEEEAQKIIDGRPYISKSDLRQREIIPAGKFYKILDRITIKIDIKKREVSAPPAAKQN